MSHTIRQADNLWFLLIPVEGTRMFWGVKWVKRSAIGPVTAGNADGYEATYIPSLRGWFLTGRVYGKQQQAVNFYLNVRGEPYPLRGRRAIQGGHHVRPFKLVDGGQLLARWPRPNPFSLDGHAFIPVGFLPQDTVFFDGVDVSVARFFVPSWPLWDTVVSVRAEDYGVHAGDLGVLSLNLQHILGMLERSANGKPANRTD